MITKKEYRKALCIVEQYETEQNDKSISWKFLQQYYKKFPWMKIHGDTWNRKIINKLIANPDLFRKHTEK